MKFDSAGRLEELIWQSRIADLPRGENRAILQRLYNGDPPFDPELAEENNVEINRNNLTGPSMLAKARRQWNSAYLGTSKYFNVTLDSGNAAKRQDWGAIITREINKELKRSGMMREQVRATGANVMLYGPGPTNWDDRTNPVPRGMGLSSLLIPSDTTIDFENLQWFAIFREWTPAKLYKMTHGPRVDPGWDMKMVDNQIKKVSERVAKQLNALAYQYMPERVEELIKQDLGFWGSDAVPTVDVWDVYFRESDDDGEGWYRRVILDWGLTNNEMAAIGANGGRPKSSTRLDDSDKDGRFLYTSGKRKFADSWSQIIACNFADTSAHAPFYYHSVRSLGWLIWGPCDLDNRMYCKFQENAFMNLMWWFRVANNDALTRLKRADFFHMGVIPEGVTIIPSSERFQPDEAITRLALEQNKELLSNNASSFTQDFSQSDNSKEMTAAETMARVNAANELVTGMLALSYSYEETKYREISRRFCIGNSPASMVRRFQLNCLKKGVPRTMLDAERWNIEAEKAIGGGSKTVQMATAQFLQTIRQNVPPRGQRIIDHISIESATDQAELAEEIAPLNEETPISDSMHDAQLSTERLMRGLPFIISPKMIPGDYVAVWIEDLKLLLQMIQQSGGGAGVAQIRGFLNMEKSIKEFLGIMAQNKADMPKVRQFSEQLSELMNAVRALGQQLIKKMEARAKQNGEANGGDGGMDPQAIAKLKGQMMISDAKAKNLRESHAQRTAQNQVQFELQQQRDDRKTRAQIRRDDAKAAQQLKVERLRAANAPKKEPTEE